MTRPRLVRLSSVTNEGLFLSPQISLLNLSSCACTQGTRKEVQVAGLARRGSSTPDQSRGLTSSTIRAQDTQSGEERLPKSPIAKEKRLARDFFLSVLSTTATKRDAKAYLQRFKAPLSSPAKPSLAHAVGVGARAPILQDDRRSALRSRKHGVNLGRLYTYPKVLEESPLFTQQTLPDKYIDEDNEPLHLAIVKIRQPQSLLDSVLDGVGLTLAQLARLGLQTIVVVDCQNNSSINSPTRAQMKRQAERLAQVIQSHNPRGARVVDQAIALHPQPHDIPSRIRLSIDLRVSVPNLLLLPIQHGIIPVVPALGYNTDQRITPVDADEVVLALTKAFAGLDEAVAGSEALSIARSKTAIDRIILLDPIGGLPKTNSADNSHIFINLEQEYHEIRQEQERLKQTKTPSHSSPESDGTQLGGGRHPAASETSKEAITASLEPSPLTQSWPKALNESGRRIKNLDLIHHALSLLPPASSALITTPEDAASSANSPQPNVLLGVGTRLKRNPLIHNLLTDRPVVSSSLPTARVDGARPLAKVVQASPPTFLKRGMPLTLVPDPRVEKWVPPAPGSPILRLEADPRVDFPRLLHLMEDSFGRKLDVKHYLKRIEGNIAGIIVAGQYEGAAILTWEKPKTASPGAPVPYLDKFAVLRKSQGSGGVADILFNAMVRTCFPDGVVWRSRKNNPVNKWYFERASGTFKIPDSQWCMFWTGEVDIESRWPDYVSACEGIQASWADAR